MNRIKINPQSRVAKFQQVVDNISSAIENGQLHLGDQIPSINQLCENTDLARGTITKAYDALRALGIISSQPGKGYYVASTITRSHLNIFLLFDQLNAYKEILYNAFKQALGDSATVTIFFHHYNRKLFENLINDNLGNFNYYVIINYLLLIKIFPT
jgi:DNA-binding transcriptional regulator YhcF (GntR family)